MAKTVVLDANILIRAVLGVKANKLIRDHVNHIDFLTVEEAFEDALKYVPQILEKRQFSEEVIQSSLSKLKLLRDVVQVIAVEHIESYESQARQRLEHRDEDDWLYVALALRFNCPIWTEDKDFFGTGVAVWTSDKIEIFLEEDFS